MFCLMTLIGYLMQLSQALIFVWAFSPRLNKQKIGYLNFKALTVVSLAFPERQWISLYLKWSPSRTDMCMSIQWKARLTNRKVCLGRFQRSNAIKAILLLSLSRIRSFMSAHLSFCKHPSEVGNLPHNYLLRSKLGSQNSRVTCRVTGENIWLLYVDLSKAKFHPIYMKYRFPLPTTASLKYDPSTHMN